MFTLNRTQTRIISDSPEGLVRLEKDTTSPVSELKPENCRNLIIHVSGGLILPRAIDHHKTNASSRHLLIDQNGNEIVQMVDFDQEANHTQGFNKSSLGIELIYPGSLTARTGYPYSKNRFDPLEIVYGHSVNNPRNFWWPLFPDNQMDTLLEVIRTLDQAFQFERILADDDIDETNLNMGPAFPKNRLRQLLIDEGETKDLKEETSAEAEIFTQPGGVEVKMLEEPLPPQTPIVVLEEREGWALVEVMATVGDRRWMVGWIDINKIAVPVFTPGVNDNHLLTAGIANRRIKFVKPAENNYNPDKKLDPKYVVIHFSTGTDFRSTIHHFLQPASGVSAHLLVARSGLVVQFVPFNETAFHVGPSYWEGDKDLNPLAIGIEVDNAGYLKFSKRRGFKSQYDVPIPAEQVKSKKHWRENRVLPWQKFPDDQIKVVEKIVRALKEKYPGIEEIVGHDMVNLINRTDPGPLYPMGELRNAVLGDPQPNIIRFRTGRPCPVYENLDDKPPHDVNHDFWGELPMRSRVRIRNGEVYERWSKVIVKSTTAQGLSNKEGWIRSNSIEPGADGVALTKINQRLFKVIPAVSPRFPPIIQRNLPEGKQLRKLFDKHPKWSLVAPVLEQSEVIENDVPRFVLQITEDMQGFDFAEGWVEKANLEGF